MRISSLSLSALMGGVGIVLFAGHPRRPSSLFGLPSVEAWSSLSSSYVSIPASPSPRRHPFSARGIPPRTTRALFAKAKPDDEDDDDDDDDEDEEESVGGGGDSDWRAFKARLVNMELREAKHLDPVDPEDVHLEEDGLILEGDGKVPPSAASSKSSSSKPSSSRRLSSSALSEDLWAYDVLSDPLSSLRPGSVLLYRPLPPETASGGYYGYGLGRQYMHKSIVLIQEVNENEVTGVVLNRGPYGEGWGLKYRDENDDDADDGNVRYRNGGGDDGDDHEWDVWFGGDARSLVDDEGYVGGGPVFYCLHDITGKEEVDKVSMKRFEGVQFTTPTNARALVEAGHATPSDFWTFCGYLHWPSKAIADEVSDGLWHVVETDPAALFHELKRLRRRAAPDDEKKRVESKRGNNGLGEEKDDDAGIGKWDALMEMITRRDECVVECEVDDGVDHTFDDAMLREWTAERLNRGPPMRLPPPSSGSSPAEGPKPPDVKVRAGDLVRAALHSSPLPHQSQSHQPSSPFLLSDHEFHKSLVLITQDDDAFTVGVVLNIPSARTAEMQLTMTVAATGGEGEGEGGGGKDFFFDSTLRQRGPVSVGTVPVRYGGPFDFMGNPGADAPPLFFLHRHARMASAGIGERVGAGRGGSGIWRCSAEDATDAVRKGVASPRDFLAVNGFCVWEKERDPERGTPTGRGGIQEEIADGRFEVVPPEGVGPAWDLLLRQRRLSDGRSVDENLRLSNEAWGVAGCGKDAEVSGEGRSLADDATKRWVEGFLLGEAADFRESNPVSE